MSAALRDLLRTGATVLVAAIAAALATAAGAAGAPAPRAVAATAMAPQIGAATALAPQIGAARAGATDGRGDRAGALSLAIVVRDQTALRATPHESAPQQALLWQGDVVEVRGERIDHLQVWDYRRERGGYVDASRVRRSGVDAADAPALLAVLRFVRDTPGQEALGIGLAAAWLRAAPADSLRGSGGAEAFDAIGTMAERLAQRATEGAGPGRAAGATPGRAEAALAAHLEVVARYGVAFTSFEREGAMRLCYDGDAFRRVLATPSADAAQRARAALGLTRPECIDPALAVTERQRLDAWRAEVLDRVDTGALAKVWQGRVAMRRAGVWSALAFQHARRGDAGAAGAAGQRALAELGDVARGDLADEDVAAWNDAAIRVGASRWAAAPSGAAALRSVRVVTEPGEPGQTCVSLVATGRAGGDAATEAKDAAAKPLRRCTYGVVWAASAVLNREGTALALAVQPMEAWRELWVFTRQGKDAWSLQVLPPGTAAPELGYAEFAGWVPGGRQILAAREARGARGLRRSFEVVRLDTLGTERQAGDPAVLGAFMRWQDAAWKRETVSVR